MPVVIPIDALLLLECQVPPLSESSMSNVLPAHTLKVSELDDFGMEGNGLIVVWAVMKQPEGRV